MPYRKRPLLIISMSEEEMNGLPTQIKAMIESTMVSYEERVIANTSIFEIEQGIGIPMPEFGKLPITVQYILIRQSRQISDYYAQIEDIREHLDSTPI